jgi:hypothetical protein
MLCELSSPRTSKTFDELRYDAFLEMVFKRRTCPLKWVAGLAQW